MPASSKSVFSASLEKIIKAMTTIKEDGTILGPRLLPAPGAAILGRDGGEESSVLHCHPWWSPACCAWSPPPLGRLRSSHSSGLYNFQSTPSGTAYLSHSHTYTKLLKSLTRCSRSTSPPFLRARGRSWSLEHTPPFLCGNS